MGEQRTSRLKGILQRVEEHVEDWRKRDAALKAEADDMRDQMWAEAAERERLLAEAMESEEARRASIRSQAPAGRGAGTVPSSSGDRRRAASATTAGVR